MKKRNSILLSSLFVTILTLFIKILGLAKQSVLAAYCGATVESDIFFVVTGIINHLCSAIFSALTVTLLTKYTEKKTEEGDAIANDLISSALKLFIPVSLLLVCTINILAHPIAHFLAPNYNENDILIFKDYNSIIKII